MILAPNQLARFAFLSKLREVRKPEIAKNRATQKFRQAEARWPVPAAGGRFCPKLWERMGHEDARSRLHANEIELFSSDKATCAKVVAPRADDTSDP